MAFTINRTVYLSTIEQFNKYWFFQTRIYYTILYSQGKEVSRAIYKFPKEQSYVLFITFFFFFFLRFYLFMREKEAETQAEGEEAPCREPDVGLDPGSPGSRPRPKAGPKPLSHPGIPCMIRIFLCVPQVSFLFILYNLKWAFQAII